MNTDQLVNAPGLNLDGLPHTLTMRYHYELEQARAGVKEYENLLSSGLESDELEQQAQGRLSHYTRRLLALTRTPEPNDLDPERARRALTTWADDLAGVEDIMFLEVSTSLYYTLLRRPEPEEAARVVTAGGRVWLRRTYSLGYDQVQALDDEGRSVGRTWLAGAGCPETGSAQMLYAQLRSQGHSINMANHAVVEALSGYGGPTDESSPR